MSYDDKKYSYPFEKVDIAVVGCDMVFVLE